MQIGESFSMTYEAMTQVQQTLCTYSHRVLGIYEGRRDHACSAQVHGVMDVAIDRERSLRRKTSDDAELLPADRACDVFRVCDRDQLFRALERLKHGSLADAKHALAFVQGHDDALVTYCRALNSSAHSGEVLTFIDALIESRIHLHSLRVEVVSSASRLKS